MGGMDSNVLQYVDQIAGEHRELFDRVNGLILGAYPDAVVKLSYKIPSYWRGGRQGSEADFVGRHPELKTSKGTIQIRPRDAAGISDGELLGLVHAALGE